MNFGQINSACKPPLTSDGRGAPLLVPSLARTLLSLCFLCLYTRRATPQTTPHPRLLVVSVDGLDWRYLRDRDALNLPIPNLRRLLRESRYADGVVGVWLTITWPSHTSLITGMRPDQHAILGNRRPKSQGGDYYWTVDLLKAPTLWQIAHDQGLKTAAITWPVTVGAAIDFNLPEYFLRRQGGSMDLDSVAAKATPGLVAEIAKDNPSFAHQWVDDRTRVLAALYLLRTKQPDLLLIHLVDLDSEEHDRGPYKQNANAVLERTDEQIGDLLVALPSAYTFALVSDHGFERVDKTANPRVLLAQNKITGNIAPLDGTSPPLTPLSLSSCARRRRPGQRDRPGNLKVRVAPIRTAANGRSCRLSTRRSRHVWSCRQRRLLHAST